MLFNSIFPLTDGVIFDALTPQYWIPAAAIFGFGIIFTCLPRWRSSKTNRKEPVQIHLESQFGVVLFVGIPLLFLSLIVALSSLKDRQMLSSALKNEEVKYYQGTAAMLSSSETYQQVMIAEYIFETRRNRLPNEFDNGCPRKCKIRDNMLLEVAFFEDRIVGVREIKK